MKLKMLSIIGLVLFISGTAITTYVTISYRNTSSKAREEIKTQNEKISKLNTKIDSTTLKNNELSKDAISLSIDNKKLSRETKELSIENKSLTKEIRSLSIRLSEQSKVIEAQITGGESYIILELISPDSKLGSRTFNLHIENKFKNTIHNLQIHFLNIDEINKNCKKEKDGVSYLIKDCYEKNRLVIIQGQVDPNAKISLAQFKISENDSSKYYNLTVFARNGTFKYKIFVDRIDGVIMGYVIQIEKNNKVIDRYSKLLISETGYQIDQSKINFKENYTFVDSKTEIRREYTKH